MGVSSWGRMVGNLRSRSADGQAFLVGLQQIRDRGFLLPLVTCFLPCSCPVNVPVRTGFPKKAKNLIGKGHSHPFNFTWAVIWNIMQSQC